MAKTCEIHQFDFYKGSQFFGKYFIIDPENPKVYLHSDGQWRNTVCVFNEDGYPEKWTGYFDTEEEVRAAVEKHERSE